MNPIEQRMKLIFSVLIVVILAAGVFYLVEKSKKAAVPINVLVPRNYPEGTKVALYDTREESSTYRETMEFLAGDNQQARAYAFLSYRASRREHRDYNTKARRAPSSSCRNRDRL